MNSNIAILLITTILTCLIAPGVFALLYFRNLGKFLRLLEEKEHELWIELRRPTLALSGMKFRTSFGLVSYLLKGRFNKLEKPELVEYARKAKNYLIWSPLPWVFLIIIVNVLD